MSDALVVCCNCGSVNRLPSARRTEKAKCGSCGEKFFSGVPHDVPAAIFDRQIARASLPVLVDAWAAWCGPCRMMAPAYQAAASELEPDVVLLKLDTEKQQAVASRLAIRSIPTMLLFHGGREIGRISGALSTSQIVRWVRERLPSVAA